jgi:Putative restriction endonuclease
MKCGLPTGKLSLFSLLRARYGLLMDPKSPGPGFLLAPGASGPALHLPGARDPEPMPRVDDHLVRPETREEMVRGRRIVAAPAKQPHARRQAEVAYVVRAHVASGYEVDTELLTRVGPRSDFATDVCVLRTGIDPATGTRYLEELAFEVVSEQSLRDITERAEDLSDRGVRRLIAIFVKKNEVADWSPETKRWIPLPFDTKLEDPTLARPMRVQALFDAAVADNEVVDALAAKGNARLAQREADARAEGLTKGHGVGRTEGRTEGLMMGITALCEAFHIRVGPSERSQMQALDAAGLEALLAHLKANRRWPTT